MVNICHTGDKLRPKWQFWILLSSSNESLYLIPKKLPPKFR